LIFQGFFIFGKPVSCAYKGLLKIKTPFAPQMGFRIFSGGGPKKLAKPNPGGTTKEVSNNFR